MSNKTVIETYNPAEDGEFGSWYMDRCDKLHDFLYDDEFKGLTRPKRHVHKYKEPSLKKKLKYQEDVRSVAEKIKFRL